MKKELTFFFAIFLVLGIVLTNVSLVIAQDSNSTDEDSNDDNSSSGSDKDEDDDSDEDKNEERDRERTREETRIIERADGSRIEIERKVEVKEGEVNVRIQRKIIDENGDVIEKTIVIERDSEGASRKVKIETKDGREIEIETEVEIEEDDDDNGSHIRARLSNGNHTKIIILPDRASEIARERLKANNFTVEIREVQRRNMPMVVYHIESDKEGRFLGIFKMRVRLEGQIDPETGEVIEIDKPWWAFLVSGEDSDQTSLRAFESNSSQ